MNKIEDFKGNDLDPRQLREREYHREYAASQATKEFEPVPLDIIESSRRRPWNGYWTTYDMLMAESLKGKSVLVPGCGFGDDAIRLSKLGAKVSAFDLSPDLLDITRKRAANMGVHDAVFDVMPAETLIYPDNSFDIVFFNDILHHVDIERAVAEAKRVLKPGGKVIANELYTHTRLQAIRNSSFVTQYLYKPMTRFIYGTDKPYITEDEHKIDEHELGILERNLMGHVQSRYFLFLGGRVLPKDWLVVANIDRAVFALGGPMRRILAGRVVLSGVIAK